MDKTDGVAAAGGGAGTSGAPGPKKEDARQEDNDPLINKDDENNKDEENMSPSGGSGSGSDSSFNSSSSYDSSMTAASFDDDKFIWEQRDLDTINKRRKNTDTIPAVKRDKNSEFGIRAHTDMDFAKCSKSLILPWHNEWVNIWLYLGFAVYFWIQLAFILGKHKLY